MRSYCESGRPGTRGRACIVGTLIAECQTSQHSALDIWQIAGDVRYPQGSFEVWGILRDGVSGSGYRITLRGGAQGLLRAPGRSALRASALTPGRVKASAPTPARLNCEALTPG